MLIKSGADVNAIAKSGPVTRRGGTTLDMANEIKLLEIADLLRKHGAKPGEELQSEGK